MSGLVALGPAAAGVAAGAAVLGAEWLQARVANRAAVAIGAVVRGTSVSSGGRAGEPRRFLRRGQWAGFRVLPPTTTAIRPRRASCCLRSGGGMPLVRIVSPSPLRVL